MPFPGGKIAPALLTRKKPQFAGIGSKAITITGHDPTVDNVKPGIQVLLGTPQYGDGTIVRPPELLVPHPNTAVGDLLVAVGRIYAGSLVLAPGEAANWTDRNAVLGTGVSFLWRERVATLTSADNFTRQNVAAGAQNFFCCEMLTLKASAGLTPTYLQLGTIHTADSTSFPVDGMNSIVNTQQQVVITFYGRKRFSGINYGQPPITLAAPANHTVAVQQTGYTTGAGGHTYSWMGIATSTNFQNGAAVPTDDIGFTPSSGLSDVETMNSRYALA